MTLSAKSPAFPLLGTEVCRCRGKWSVLGHLTVGVLGERGCANTTHESGGGSLRGPAWCALFPSEDGGAGLVARPWSLHL